jgi:hypothetical protein
MTHDTTTRALFERVLDRLTRADGSAEALLSALALGDRDTRALAVIHALLAADAALARTFTDVDLVGRDRALARDVALTLAERADRIEADRPEAAPVTLALLGLPDPAG